MYNNKYQKPILGKNSLFTYFYLFDPRQSKK